MKDPTLRPGDADLEDWRKKEGLDSSQAAKPIPTPVLRYMIIVHFYVIYIYITYTHTLEVWIEIG